MTSLVVGCGYLGCRVARILSARGERVYGTTRTEARTAAIAATGAEPVILDVRDPEAVGRLPRVDRVLYCVSYDRAAGPSRREVCLDGLRNVLRGLSGRLVYVGSTSVYGRDDGGWVDEDTPEAPVTEPGRVGLEAERLAAGLAPGNGSGLVVRFSGLYGPGRIVGAGRLAEGQPILAEPDSFLNLIHIDDAAAAAVALLDRGEPGRVYLATDDRPVLRREYYTLAAACLGTAPPRFEPPEPGPREAERTGTNKRISNRRIKEELGLRLQYPDITTGLPAALSGDGPGMMEARAGQ